jgi:hypothetical protein
MTETITPAVTTVADPSAAAATMKPLHVADTKSRRAETAIEHCQLHQAAAGRGHRDREVLW